MEPGQGGWQSRLEKELISPIAACSCVAWHGEGEAAQLGGRNGLRWRWL